MSNHGTYQHFDKPPLDTISSNSKYIQLFRLASHSVLNESIMLTNGLFLGHSSSQEDERAQNRSKMNASTLSAAADERHVVVVLCKYLDVPTTSLPGLGYSRLVTVE